MAALKAEVKAFIVQQLACFDTPTQVVEAVKKEFGVITTRQQVEGHDPTKAAGKKLSEHWVLMFNETREKFCNETSHIPIANKAFRLRALNRMVQVAEERKNFALAAQLLEQAAKEAGGAFTNKREHDLKSSDGSMTPSKNFTADEYVRAQAKLQGELKGLD